MKKLSKEQFLMLHSMAIKQYGGLDGVRDNGLLDMAMHAPFQTFESTELYSSIQSKAARLTSISLRLEMVCFYMWVNFFVLFLGGLEIQTDC